jgi:aromatic-L-amino-acid decarboxylase
MDVPAFRRHAHELVDWMADYLEGIEQYPVRSPAHPQETLGRLPTAPPATGEPFERIMDDFRAIILPGMTHWQHPSFFAYFPANSSPPSVLAEMLTATLGAQCMSWVTSPAATELEQRMMEWLREMLALPAGFTGVIQDSASSATLCAILSAREARSDFRINERGFDAGVRLTAYCTSETHSSVEKGVKIAGLGRAQLRTVAVDETHAMLPDALDREIRADLAAGATPLIVVASLGTTGSTAIDPLRAIAGVCRAHGVWLHVDAAFGGSALLLPECRWMSDGMEHADSFVFNPHKWLLTNFDCSAYFVKDPATLVRTFEILPEYLKTAEAERVNNYRDWGIPLGRRFRALKLWFVIRTYGVEGLQGIVREHMAIAREARKWIEDSGDFEMLAPTPLSVLCFRYHPAGVEDPGALNTLNAALLERVNATGKIFCTHTRLRGTFVIRLVVGQASVARRHVEAAWQLISTTARSMR